MGPSETSAWIREHAREMGFLACGISEAGELQEEKMHLEDWLRQGLQGEMGYMERNLDKRLDPRRLLPGARSVISFLFNYFPKQPLPAEDNLTLSKYAYGRDYHRVIRDKLHLLLKELKLAAGDFSARAFTDSAPVLDRAWAHRSGLGWIGKNTCLIHPKHGSFFFIAEIITDLELEADRQRINDLCGGCTRCIDMCPTGAIIAPRVLDARKCISYLTIEYQGELPEEHREKFGEMIFGCDICQDVCPWNKFSRPHNEPRFEPPDALKALDRQGWLDLDPESFEKIFKESAVQRTEIGRAHV